MIATLKGTLLEISGENIILEVGGVGYELHCATGTLAGLQERRGKMVFLQVYTHVREDALQLFGFYDKFEKQLFLSLLKVSGIGPKMAVHILSGASSDQIMDMIENEDVKGLSKLPKVGKKIAEQMILTLKGKLVLSGAKASGEAPLTSRREIVSALVNLGFRAVDVEKVVSQLPKQLEFEEGVRQGLAALTSL